MVTDLNRIEYGEGDLPHSGVSNVTNEVASVSAFFKNIQSNLLSVIQSADAVFGCAAWLTDKEIINALIEKENSSIVILDHKFNTSLKEAKANANWIKIKDLANAKNTFYRLTKINKLTWDSMELVKGHSRKREHEPESPIHRFRKFCPKKFYRDDKDSAIMHHKFLIFARVGFDNATIDDVEIYYQKKAHHAPHMTPVDWLKAFGKPTIEPYAVWTGSFNFSAAASRHLENAVLISNQKIAEAYFQEFTRVYSLSEPIANPEA